MSLRLRALELHLPGWARVGAPPAVRETASAFGCEPPDVRGLDRRMLLDGTWRSARARRAGVLSRRGDLEVVSRRMWRARVCDGRVAAPAPRRALALRRRSRPPGSPTG